MVMIVKDHEKKSLGFISITQATRPDVARCWRALRHRLRRVAHAGESGLLAAVNAERAGGVRWRRGVLLRRLLAIDSGGQPAAVDARRAPPLRPRTRSARTLALGRHWSEQNCLSWPGL